MQVTQSNLIMFPGYLPLCHKTNPLFGAHMDSTMHLMHSFHDRIYIQFFCQNFFNGYLTLVDRHLNYTLF